MPASSGAGDPDGDARHQPSPDPYDRGRRGYEVDTWNGFAVPGGTPREIVTLLHTEITAILDLPDVKAKILAVGLEPASNTPEQFADNLVRGIALRTRVVKNANLTFD